MSTLRTNAILDAAGGNTTTINGALPVNVNSLRTELNATGSAPMYVCRAWVNFNGVTTTTIRAHGNVSSVVRNSAANYTINFINAMPHANFVVAGVTGAVQFNVGFGTVSGSIMPRTTTSVQIVIGNGDQADIQIAVFC